MGKKAIFLYSLILIGAVIWLGLIFLAPYLKSKVSESNIFIYALFSPFCHQLPSRSFFIFSYPLAVCARCLGIYSGFFAGTLLFPLVRRFSNLSIPKARIFILLTLPAAVDFLGNFLHLWRTANWLRYSTGFIWGSILPFYFIPGMMDLLLKLKRRKTAFGVEAQPK